MRRVCFLDSDMLAFELGDAEFCEAPVIVKVFSLYGRGKDDWWSNEKQGWMYQAKIGRD